MRVHSIAQLYLTLVTAWTVAHQTPLSMGFPRQEYWSGLPFPFPDLPHAGIEPASPVSPALAGGVFTTESPGKPIGTLLDKYNKWKFSVILYFEN